MRTRRRKNNPECVHCAFNCPSAVITARPRPGASKHCARPWPGGGEWPRPRATPHPRARGQSPRGWEQRTIPPAQPRPGIQLCPRAPHSPSSPSRQPGGLGPPAGLGEGPAKGRHPWGGAAGLTRQAGFVSEKDKRSHLRAQNHMWKVTEAGSLDVLMAGPGPRPPPGAPHGHGAGASTGEGKPRAPPDRGASRDSRGCEAGCW